MLTTLKNTPQHYVDPYSGRETVKILPGEYFVSDKNKMIVTTLGSCISACIRDTKTGIGGMNHFMLPESEEGKWAGASAATRYGNFAMEKLINDILSLGSARKYLEAKIFGGALLNGDANGLNVGGQNASFAKKYLDLENIPIAAIDVGGPYSRKVYYEPETGKVMVKKLTILKNNTIENREIAYRTQLKSAPVEGETELF